MPCVGPFLPMLCCSLFFPVFESVYNCKLIILSSGDPKELIFDKFKRASCRLAFMSHYWVVNYVMIVIGTCCCSIILLLFFVLLFFLTPSLWRFYVVFMKKVLTYASFYRLDFVFAQIWLAFGRIIIGSQVCFFVMGVKFLSTNYQ